MTEPREDPAPGGSSFGLPWRAQPKEARVQERLAVEVADVKKDAFGKYIFRMAVGQVWVENDTRRFVLAGDGLGPAEIRRSPVGRYLLKPQGSKLSVTVKRIR